MNGWRVQRPKEESVAVVNLKAGVKVYAKDGND